MALSLLFLEVTSPPQTPLPWGKEITVLGHASKRQGQRRMNVNHQREEQRIIPPCFQATPLRKAREHAYPAYSTLVTYSNLAYVAYAKKVLFCIIIKLFTCKFIPEIT